MFWIHGKLCAEGTEDEPIIFTRAQDSLYFHWGIIYFDEDAQMPYFSKFPSSVSGDFILNKKYNKYQEE